MVTHRIGYDVPGVWSLSNAVDEMSEVHGSRATEYDRFPVNYHLQSLEPTALPEVGGVRRDIAVDEGIRLTAIIDRRRVAGGAARVLNDVDVCFGVWVNSLIARLAKESVERLMAG